MLPNSVEGKSKATLAPAFRDDDFIQIHDISKSYGIVEALKNVNFGITKGEVHTLLGENGAGKSTLVKIIMGEETPDSGAIQINGQHDHKLFTGACPQYGHFHGASGAGGF